MQATGARHTKRTESLQPSECVEICKKDSGCKSVNIDYKAGTCEFFDEQNTVGMEVDSSKDAQQSVGSTGLQGGQFAGQQSSQFNLQQSTGQSNLGQLMQQKSNPPAGLMQAKNRSLSIFQTAQDQPAQQTYQQTINDQKSSRIQLKANPNVNYFVKTCLTELNSCEQMWSFERHVGRRLELMNGEKNLDGNLYAERLIANVTREQCQSACLKHSLSNQELNRQSPKYGAQQFNLQSAFKAKESTKDGKEPATSFVCRSANFNAKTGACKLLSYNQHTTFGKPIKLEDDKSHLEYIESSCIAGGL